MKAYRIEVIAELAPSHLSLAECVEVDYPREQHSVVVGGGNPSECAEVAKEVVRSRYQQFVHVFASGCEKIKTDSVDAEVPRYVYLMRSGPFYKVGVSANPDWRRRRIVDRLGVPVELIHSFLSYKPFQVERDLHKRYAKLAIGREWFALKSQHVADIQAMQGETRDE